MRHYKECEKLSAKLNSMNSEWLKTILKNMDIDIAHRKEITSMPKTKDGGFILDDSSCDPYGLVEMRKKIDAMKKRKSKNTSKKHGTGKKQ